MIPALLATSLMLSSLLKVRPLALFYFDRRTVVHAITSWFPWPAVTIPVRTFNADDIGNGIDSADFVEMGFFDGHVVDGGFGVAQFAKDVGCHFLRARGACDKSPVDARRLEVWFATFFVSLGQPRRGAFTTTYSVNPASQHCGAKWCAPGSKVF